MIVLLLCAAYPAWAGVGADRAPVQDGPPRISSTAPHQQDSPPRLLVYTLSPEDLARSRSLYHWYTALDFAESAWGILAVLACLSLGWIAKLRDWAVCHTQRRWLQGIFFAPALLLLLAVLDLPLSVVAHHISLAYGQSVQGWGSWFLDRGKGLLLDMAVGTLVLSAVFALIRASSRWWLWLWLLSLPFQAFAVLILPVVIDPLFNHFEPLSQSNPALVQQLEKVVAKAGIEIPPARMYLMRASVKVTGANAYVTGLGASKRVVVWDTALNRLSSDEILMIFGHELGHYVLNHIRRGLILGGALSFFFVWAGFHLVHYLLRRYGAGWRISAAGDWASAAVLLLVLNLLSFLAQPLVNSISRTQEHQADVFGQEVVHGIVADPQQTAAASFQHLGEEYLEYPAPNRFVVFWSYSHPPIGQRMSFAAQYDPWQPGRQPQYFKK